MISSDAPLNFTPIFEVVGCFLEYRGDILLLQRLEEKSQGNLWGIPGGKRAVSETREDGVIREVFEETGLELKVDQLIFLESLFVRYDDYDFIYHVFRVNINEVVEVSINEKEHKGFIWTSPRDAISLPLVKDCDSCIERYYFQGNSLLQ